MHDDHRPSEGNDANATPAGHSRGSETERSTVGTTGVGDLNGMVSGVPRERTDTDMSGTPPSGDVEAQ